MIEFERNLFQSDPTLLERADDAAYERAARSLAAVGDPRRLRLLHALSVGADTAARAAVWAGCPQPDAERALAEMTLAGLVARQDGPGGPVYAPRDGHLVVALHIALAHGREPIGARHPRLLKRRRDARRKVG